MTETPTRETQTTSQALMDPMLPIKKAALIVAQVATKIVQMTTIRAAMTVTLTKRRKRRKQKKQRITLSMATKKKKKKL